MKLTAKRLKQLKRIKLEVKKDDTRRITDIPTVGRCNWYLAMTNPPILDLKRRDAIKEYRAHLEAVYEEILADIRHHKTLIAAASPREQQPPAAEASWC